MTEPLKIFDYQSTLEVPSKCFPGVTFTIWRPSVSRAARIHSMLAEFYEKIADTMREIEAVSAVMKAGSDESVDADMVSMARDLHAKIYSDLSTGTPRTMVRWGLKEVKGMRIDGWPIDADLLIDDGPPALFSEILTAIQETSS